ncbi:hypothetical protein ACFX2J_023670 [Malus domestica]
MIHFITIFMVRACRFWIGQPESRLLLVQLVE